MNRKIIGCTIAEIAILTPALSASETNAFEMPYSFNPLHFGWETSSLQANDNYEIHRGGLESYISENYGQDNYGSMDMSGMNLEDIVTNKSKDDIVPTFEGGQMTFSVWSSQLSNIEFILNNVINYNDESYSVYFNIEESDITNISPEGRVDLVFSINADGNLDMDIRSVLETKVTVDTQILDSNGKKVNAMMGLGVYNLHTENRSSEAVEFPTADVNNISVANSNVKLASTEGDGVYFVNNSDFDLGSAYGQGEVTNFSDATVELYSSKLDDIKTLDNSEFSFDIYHINKQLPIYYGLTDKEVIASEAPKTEEELIELLDLNTSVPVKNLKVIRLDDYSYAEPNIGTYRIGLEFDVDGETYSTTVGVKVIDDAEKPNTITVNAKDEYSVPTGKYDYIYQFLNDNKIAVETYNDGSLVETNRIIADNIVYDSNIDFNTPGEYKIVYKQHNSEGQEAFGYFTIKID